MRAKIYYISQRHLLAMLRNLIRTADILEVTETEGPPEGAKFYSLFVDNTRQAIGVIVTHDSFDEVEEGSPIPIADGDQLRFKTHALWVVNDRLVANWGSSVEELEDARKVLSDRIEHLKRRWKELQRRKSKRIVTGANEQA